MKKTLLTIAFLALAGICTTTVSADVVIFDADTTNTTLTGNGIGGDGTLSGTAGSLTYTNSGGNFNNSGFTSTDDINTLNGAAITDLDTVTFAVTVDEFNGAELRSDGVTFGINDLSVRLEASNGGGDIQTIFNGVFTDSMLTSTTAELTNGFTATLVADVDGYTFTLDSVAPTSPLVVTGAFTGTEFVDTVGGGQFFYQQQHRNNNAAANPGNLTSTISVASVSVATAVPEPSSLALICLATLGFGVRRRR